MREAFSRQIDNLKRVVETHDVGVGADQRVYGPCGIGVYPEEVGVQADFEDDKPDVVDGGAQTDPLPEPEPQIVYKTVIKRVGSVRDEERPRHHPVTTASDAEREAPATESDVSEVEKPEPRPGESRTGRQAPKVVVPRHPVRRNRYGRRGRRGSNSSKVSDTSSVAGADKSSKKKKKKKKKRRRSRDARADDDSVTFRPYPDSESGADSPRDDSRASDNLSPQELPASLTDASPVNFTNSPLRAGSEPNLRSVSAAGSTPNDAGEDATEGSPWKQPRDGGAAARQSSPTGSAFALSNEHGVKRIGIAGPVYPVAPVATAATTDTGTAARPPRSPTRDAAAQVDRASPGSRGSRTEDAAGAEEQDKPSVEVSAELVMLRAQVKKRHKKIVKQRATIAELRRQLQMLMIEAKTERDRILQEERLRERETLTRISQTNQAAFERKIGAAAKRQAELERALAAASSDNKDLKRDIRVRIAAEKKLQGYLTAEREAAQQTEAELLRERERRLEEQDSARKATESASALAALSTAIETSTGAFREMSPPPTPHAVDGEGSSSDESLPPAAGFRPDAAALQSHRTAGFAHGGRLRSAHLKDRGGADATRRDAQITSPLSVAADDGDRSVVAFVGGSRVGSSRPMLRPTDSSAAAYSETAPPGSTTSARDNTAALEAVLIGDPPEVVPPLWDECIARCNGLPEDSLPQARGTDALLVQILEEKANADALDAREGRPIMPMPAFVTQYFELRFGTEQLVCKRLVGLLASLRRNYPSDRFARLFSRFCGILEPALSLEAVTFVLTAMAHVFMGSAHAKGSTAADLMVRGNRAVEAIRAVAGTVRDADPSSAERRVRELCVAYMAALTVNAEDRLHPVAEGEEAGDDSVDFAATGATAASKAKARVLKSMPSWRDIKEPVAMMKDEHARIKLPQVPVTDGSLQHRVAEHNSHGLSGGAVSAAQVAHAEREAAAVQIGRVGRGFLARKATRRNLKPKTLDHASEHLHELRCRNMFAESRRAGIEQAQVAVDAKAAWDGISQAAVKGAAKVFRGLPDEVFEEAMQVGVDAGAAEAIKKRATRQSVAEAAATAAAKALDRWSLRQIDEEQLAAFPDTERGRARAALLRRDPDVALETPIFLIDFLEICVVMFEEVRAVRRAELTAAFIAVDENKNGLLDLEEFRELVDKCVDQMEPPKHADGPLRPFRGAGTTSGASASSVALDAAAHTKGDARHALPDAIVDRLYQQCLARSASGHIDVITFVAVMESYLQRAIRSARALLEESSDGGDQQRSPRGGPYPVTVAAGGAGGPAPAGAGRGHRSPRRGGRGGGSDDAAFVDPYAFSSLDVSSPMMVAAAPRRDL